MISLHIFNFSAHNMATVTQSIAMFILIIRLTTVLTLSPVVKHRTILDDHHHKSLVENSQRTVIDDNRRQRPTINTTINIRKYAPRSQKVLQIDNLTNIGNRLERLFRRLSAIRSREDYIYNQILIKSRRQRASFEMSLLENSKCFFNKICKYRFQCNAKQKNCFRVINTSRTNANAIQRRPACCAVDAQDSCYAIRFKCDNNNNASTIIYDLITITTIILYHLSTSLVYLLTSRDDVSVKSTAFV